MRKTSAYFISLLLTLICSRSELNAQDTVLIPLKIRIGIEASGPAIYFSDKNTLNTEGYISVDINEKVSAVIGGGYLDYKYSQYNYNYLNKGIFARAGADFNLLKANKSLGRYWAGIGLRYGISMFNWEVPAFQQENYWGKGSSSITQKTNWGHFLEASPGVRAELFKNFSIGWTISLRMLLYTGTGKDQRPIYFPGFGNGGKNFSSGLSYFFVWNIPYKKINVIIPKEVPEETEETAPAGAGQQGTGIRQ